MTQILIVKNTAGVIPVLSVCLCRGVKTGFKGWGVFLFIFAAPRVPVSGGQIQKNTGSW
tara:strand:+ start:164 stop:340 length:177 start_codon:yes stop_codon:yes gene_type:complete